MTVPRDPKVVLLELLQAEYDASNHASLAPDLRTGWRDSTLTAPLVTVGPDDSTPTSDTGYDGIAGDGSGPTATERGVVDVNAWATRAVVNENPKKAVAEYTAEVARVLKKWGHRLDAHPTVNAPEYRYLSWNGRTFLPEEPNDPEADTEFRYRAEVNLETHDDRQ